MVARSATGSYHICFPAANRWIALPLPPIATDHNTANGFHYDIGAEPGIILFMAVLLNLAGVDVAMFPSKTGNWETKALVVQEDAARDHGRGQPSPGIHAGNCFYWLSASGHGGVLCLDVARGLDLIGARRADAGRGVHDARGAVSGVVRQAALAVRLRHPRQRAEQHPASRRRGRPQRVAAAGRRERLAARARGGGARRRLLSSPVCLAAPRSEVLVNFAGASGSAIINKTTRTRHHARKWGGGRRAGKKHSD